MVCCHRGREITAAAGAVVVSGNDELGRRRHRRPLYDRFTMRSPKGFLTSIS